MYLNGGACDVLVRDNRLAELTEVLKFMQAQAVPCGLGAHSLETVKKCEGDGSAARLLGEDPAPEAASP